MSTGWTFQELIDRRMTITAYCGGCNRNKVLELEVLRDKFGPDAPAMAADIAPKLKCDRCGARKASLIYSPPDTNKITNISSPYAKAKGG
jgi:hypothetical protein